MKKLSIFSLALAGLLCCFSNLAFGQGEDSPLGVNGVFNGNITTAGDYDGYTGNMRRVVDDIIVPGSVGKYPLKWSRYYNSRNKDGGGAYWGFSNNGFWHDASGTILGFPDGRVYNCWDQCPSGADDMLGPFGATDGGQVLWQQCPGGGQAAYGIMDPYGQVTTFTFDCATALTQITEPGGRYLKLIYDPLVPGRINRVEAYDGVSPNFIQAVAYTYSDPLYGGAHPEITRVDYIDRTSTIIESATYTYVKNSKQPPNEGPLLSICDDVRYSGPMRQIAYNWGSNSGGKVLAEKNMTTGEAVSTPSYSIGSDTHARRETRGDGPTRDFHYTGGTLNPGKLDSCTDFLGHTTTIAYNPYVHTVTDANNHTTTYNRWINQYGMAEFAIGQIVYADGSTVEQTFKEDAGELPVYLKTKTLPHGPNDPVRTITPPRDAKDRITRIDYPDGGFETFTYDNGNSTGLGLVTSHLMTNGGTESFTYDSRGMKLTSTDGDGAVTNYSYYGPSDHPEWTDRLKTVTHPPNASNQRASETYEYDRMFVSGVDTGATCAGRGLVTKITHADGTYQTFTHDIYGNLLSSTDEMFHTTSHTYDVYKRVVTTKDANNNITTNSYIPTGFTSSTITTSASPFSVTLPSTKKTNYYYDGNWKKTRVQQAPGTGDEANSYFTYDPVGNMLTSKDPRNYITNYGYDSRDRLTSTTDPGNHVVSTVYDQRGVKTSDTAANGLVTSYDSYDPMYRLTQLTVHDGAPGYIRTMQYDCAGRLTTNHDENTSPYSYSYNYRNLRTNMTYPDTSKQENTSYDAAGNVATYTNRAGKIQTSTYDIRNRQLSFSWNDTPSTSQSFVYDAASRATEISNSMSNTAGAASSVIDFTYDAANRLLTEQESTNAFGDTAHRAATVYTYDVDNNRQNIQYPSGTASNYTYTNRNQASAVKPGLSGGTAVASYIYDPSGNITSRSLDNGTTTTYTVNIDNLDTAVVHALVGTTARRFDYAYNSTHDILAMQRDSGVGDGFVYDLRQEVLTYQQNGTVNLATGVVTSPATTNNETFDGCGNRTALNGTAQTYNNMNQPTGGTFNYDAEGCLQSYNGWTYTYDVQNRLTNATNGTTTAEFYYDGKNRQVARRINGVVTFSVWDDWELIEEYTTGNVRTAAYLQGAHGPVKSLLGTVFYFYQDELGSTSHIADATGHLLEYYKYGLYGSPTYWNASGTQISASAYGVRDLFTGERYISETGLYDLRNRFMSPDIGRFLQPDPIGFKGDASNLYRYCGNDWGSKADPTGLDTAIIIGDGVLTNPFGHASIAMTNQGVFSFGTDSRDWGSSLSGFIGRQSERRHQWVYVIKTTPEQERRIRERLEKLQEGKKMPRADHHLIDGSQDNCTTRAVDALKAGGKDVGNPNTPAGLMRALDKDVAKGDATRDVVPEDSKTAPEKLKQFDPPAPINNDASETERNTAPSTPDALSKQGVEPQTLNDQNNG